MSSAYFVKESLPKIVRLSQQKFVPVIIKHIGYHKLQALYEVRTAVHRIKTIDKAVHGLKLVSRCSQRFRNT